VRVTHAFENDVHFSGKFRFNVNVGSVRSGENLYVKIRLHRIQGKVIHIRCSIADGEAIKNLTKVHLFFDPATSLKVRRCCGGQQIRISFRRTI
jgi:hypothetical protein